jgi:predicted enzyme related to lactoylglutathione lyase
MSGKVIGIGGIFIRCKDPKRMNQWYEDVLGMTPNEYGVLFSFNGKQQKKGYLQLGTFPAGTDYFGEKNQQSMLNFRVDNMLAIIEKLKRNEVKILNQVEEFPYGKFLHIEDPEGNRIELWEPVDQEFDSETQMEMN